MRRCFIMLTALIALSAPATRAADGSLTVKTDPEGIEVWLDDNYIGDSPILEKKLKPGRYSLKLVDPIQHSSTVEEVFIQDNEETVVEKMITGKFGGLKVSSDPEGAEVSIATALGKTPLSNEFMNPGKYRLHIQYPGKNWVPVTEEIVINKGKTISLSKTLEKKSPFNLTTLVRLGLGAGAIVSYVWAIVEQGEHKYYSAKLENNLLLEAERTEFKDKDHSAQVQRTWGIILGSACVVGFEIVAFF